jgi:hypothetical protein
MEDGIEKDAMILGKQGEQLRMKNEKKIKKKSVIQKNSIVE